MKNNKEVRFVSDLTKQQNDDLLKDLLKEPITEIGKFELDTDQIKKFLKWDKSHKKKCTVKNAGAIGGRLSFKFTPTGLGIITTVKCACGEELDLSDCENW